MALLGTKRIDRDGGGESVLRPGLLESNPYAPNFITRNDPRYDAAFGMGIHENYGATNPYDALLGLTPKGDDYWRQMGFTGPTMTQGTEQNDPTVTPELLQFMRDRGLQVATDGGRAWNALADASGNYVQGSEYSNRNNDDAAYIAGSIGLALPSLWGNLAGNAAQGGGEAVSGMDLAADGGRNALWQTGAETSTLGNTLPEIAQQAPIESLPQAAAPDLAQVPQVPNAPINGPTTFDPKLLAPLAQQAMPKEDSAPDYSNEGKNYPTPESTQGGGGSPVNASTDWMNSLKQWGGDIASWMKENPGYSKLLLGALGATAGGGGTGGGGYSYSGPMPTITRGNWSPNVQAKSMPVQQVGGLLSIPQTTTPQGNSGLWRYGLLGG